MNKSILDVLKWISHGLSMFFVLLFIVFLFGEGIGSLNLEDMLLFVFVPITYTIGAVLMLFNKDKVGDILMIIAVLGFNIVAWIIEKNYFQEFDFLIFLLPVVINYVYLMLNKKTL